MALYGPVDRLDDAQAADVVTLASRAGLAIGHTPVGDEDWARRSGSGDDGFGAAWATGADGKLVAYVQALRSPADPSWSAELLIDADERSRTADLGAPLLSAVLRLVGQHGGGTVHLWAAGGGPAHAEVAARAGLEPHRTLHQMSRPLPTGLHSSVPLRAFVVGQDEEQALEVNRRAFADHPDQGGMTLAMLEERMAEPWFDPAGFLISEIDGRIAGFCWTKLFLGSDPLVGEIHVICVDPDFAGRRLGHELVVAGLDHLAGRGATIGMLFVEGDNTAALALYERLGFEITRTDRSWTTTVATST
ncbi:MAG: mycothiol synthase [Acidimicrobiia bacterium]|nr:mycothiol synthase [Acidimicrobiia bacterium]